MKFDPTDTEAVCTARPAGRSALCGLPPGPDGAVMNEIIELLDYDGCWFVRGHVSYEDAAVAVLNHDEIDGGPPRLAPVAWHRYYRWVPDGTGEYHMLWYRSRRGRGAIAVTEIWEDWYWRRREEMRAVEYRARIETQRQWPHAEILGLNRWHWEERHHVSVRFRLPETGRDEHVWTPWKDSEHVRLGGQESWMCPMPARLDRWCRACEAS